MIKHFKPKKMYSVGEIIRILKENKIKLSRQTIHNYTMMSLISEAERTPAGHRLYAEEVFENLRKIEMWKRHRTLKEIKQMLAAKK